MPYDADMVVKTNRPYNVFRRLKEPNYATNIAKNLEIPQQVVSEIIGLFKEEWSLVEVAKRNKATYYKIKYENLTEVWKELLKSKYNYNAVLCREQKQAVQDILEGWVPHYLTTVDNSTIRQMLLDNLFVATSTTTHQLLSKNEKGEIVSNPIHSVKKDIQEKDGF